MGVWYHTQEDVNVIRPGLAAARYASVKKVAQITHLIHEELLKLLVSKRRITVYLYCLISYITRNSSHQITYLFNTSNER